MTKHKAADLPSPTPSPSRVNEGVRGRSFRLKRVGNAWLVETLHVWDGRVVEVSDSVPNVFAIIADELVELAKADAT